MSGSTVPYALRHNKFVDRRVFIELLGRIERFSPLDDHVYISMGGASLEDHRLAHAHLGLTKMLSFDAEDWVVARQRFNKPVDYVQVEKFTSGELIGNWSAELHRLGFGGAPNVAVWLDFTAPKELGSQLRELNQLLNNLQPTDIVRMTVNASASALYAPQKDNGKLETADIFRRKRLEKLENRLDEYLPDGITPEDMTDQRLPSVIARAIEMVALDAFPSSSAQAVLPLSSIAYSDGQQMLSVTMVVLDRQDIERFMSQTRAESWPYFSAGWTDIHSIAIPDLTVRERMFINERIPQEPSQVCQLLGFAFNDDLQLSEKFMMQYQKYYRYYPHFHYVSF